MFIRLSFVTLIFAMAALGTPVKRDVDQLEEDIQRLQAKVKAVDGAVNTFPNSGGTFGGALAIHQAAVGLDKALKDATKDATASDPFTEAQANAVLRGVADDVPLIQKTLRDLEGKRDALTAIDAKGIVALDLKSLRTDTDALGNAIIDKSPADKKSDGQALLNEIDNAFNSAMAMYS